MEQEIVQNELQQTAAFGHCQLEGKMMAAAVYLRQNMVPQKSDRHWGKQDGSVGKGACCQV